MRLFKVIIILGGLLLPLDYYASVQAHTQRTAITTVLLNPRTNNLEIMHRFRLHDAEHAVGEIFGKNADILASDDTRQKFAEYVSNRFQLRNGETQTQIPLTFIGYEIEGNFIWVYQETATPKTTTLEITHNALRDLWPDQVNTVNVEGAFGVKSALFNGDIEIARITLKTH